MKILAFFCRLAASAKLLRCLFPSFASGHTLICELAPTTLLPIFRYILHHVSKPLSIDQLPPELTYQAVSTTSPLLRNSPESRGAVARVCFNPYEHTFSTPTRYSTPVFSGAGRTYSKCVESSKLNSNLNIHHSEYFTTTKVCIRQVLKIHVGITENDVTR